MLNSDALIGYSLVKLNDLLDRVCIYLLEHLLAQNGDISTIYNHKLFLNKESNLVAYVR